MYCLSHSTVDAVDDALLPLVAFGDQPKPVQRIDTWWLQPAGSFLLLSVCHRTARRPQTLAIHLPCLIARYLQPLKVEELEEVKVPRSKEVGGVCCRLWPQLASLLVIPSSNSTDLLSTRPSSWYLQCGWCGIWMHMAWYMLYAISSRTCL